MDFEMHYSELEHPKLESKEDIVTMFYKALFLTDDPADCKIGSIEMVSVSNVTKQKNQRDELLYFATITYNQISTTGHVADNDKVACVISSDISVPRFFANEDAIPQLVGEPEVVFEVGEADELAIALGLPTLVEFTSKTIKEWYE